MDPSELSDGNFYVKAELTDDIPEGAAVYAVYSNPQDGSIYRVKLTDGKDDIFKKYIDFPMCQCDLFYTV